MSANDKQVGGDHYKTGGMQHWDWCWQQQYDQFQYCITKYVDRHKRKNGLQDLYKARHHLEKYIELLEARMEKLTKEHKSNFPDPSPTMFFTGESTGQEPGTSYVSPDFDLGERADGM